jgi:hypothetical protein
MKNPLPALHIDYDYLISSTALITATGLPLAVGERICHDPITPFLPGRITTTLSVSIAVKAALTGPSSASF